MVQQTHNTHLTVRVSERLRAQFYVKAERYGKPSEVLRELIQAFIEDRVSIAAPSTVKESLYVNRI